MYSGKTDLYAYFYQQGFELLKHSGQLVYIAPNKFTRTNYGKALRKYLAEQVRLNRVIDFGDLPIFDATTYPMIVLADNTTPPENHNAHVLLVDDMATTEHLHTAKSFPLPQHTLGEANWQLADPKTRALMNKLKLVGQPLNQYTNGEMYMGILTGLNEAFIIDAAKRDELITADLKSDDVIKPYLRGRDVKRWQVNHQDLYIIAIQSSSDLGANNPMCQDR